MNELIQNNIDEIRQLCREHDVEKLYVFGSVAGGGFSDRSDIDFLVKFKDIPFDRYTDNYFVLRGLFENFFNRKVDLLTEKSLSNPYLIKMIDQTKTLLYEG